jgi:amino acid transporter
MIRGALIDFPNKFCSAELGFAVGVTYWVSETICMAVLNAATARIADDYGATPLDPGQRTGLVIGLVVITALSNLVGVRIYGNLERVVAVFKISLILFLAVLMIGVNFGLGGPRTGSQYGNFTTLGIVPAYRPDGFNGTLEWNILTENRTHEPYYGIPSKDGGRLFAVLTAITLAIFSCMVSLWPL